jgi:hypothetical protein
MFSRDEGKLKASNSNKTSAELECENNSRIRIASSPCKGKHMSFNQYCKTVADCPSCRWSLQFTEMFYNNPDHQTQCYDRPRSAKYPGYLHEKYDLAGEVEIAKMGTRQDIFH